MSIKPFKKCICCGRDEGEEYLDIRKGLCLICRIKKQLFNNKKLKLLKKMLKLSKAGFSVPNQDVHLELDCLLMNYINDKDIKYLWNRIPKVYSDIQRKKND